ATATSPPQPPPADPPSSPVGASYSPAQRLPITPASSGTTIYYPRDSTTPATTAGGSTLLYSSPLTIAATTTVKAIATASGFLASNVSSAAYTIATGGSGSINFGNGFVGGGMIFNGSATLNGSRLRVTDGATSEGSSAWYSTPVSVASFTNDFSFPITPGTSPTADGFAFVLQGNKTTALSPV